MSPNLLRRAASEFIATAFLLAIVVGSGTMGDRLAAGNVAIALLATTLATGAGLVALILTFGPISGAHMNPVVTLMNGWKGALAWSAAPVYLAGQVAGAITGVAAANVMFGEPALFASHHIRSGNPQLLAEFIATFGLLAVIQCGVRFRPDAMPFAVGTYITSAYWFTSSTSFANPAVTVARAFTDTFAGIRLEDTPAFIAAQLAGAAASVLLFTWLLRKETQS